MVLGEGEMHLSGLVVVLERDGAAGRGQGGSREEAIGCSGVAEEVEEQRLALVDHPETAYNQDTRSESCSCGRSNTM